LLSLFGGWKSGFVDPSKVMYEIELLEGNEKSGFKPPVQNKYPPLKGLWHKHYHQQGLQSFSMNIKNGLKRHGIPWFEQKIADAKATGEVQYLTAESKNEINDLIADVVD